MAYNCLPLRPSLPTPAEYLYGDNVTSIVDLQPRKKGSSLLAQAKLLSSVRMVVYPFSALNTFSSDSLPSSGLSAVPASSSV